MADPTFEPFNVTVAPMAPGPTIAPAMLYVGALVALAEKFMLPTFALATRVARLAGVNTLPATCGSTV